MDKTLRNALVIGILIAAFSLAYYFILRPIYRDKQLENCLQKAGERYYNNYQREDCYKRY